MAKLPPYRVPPDRCRRLGRVRSSRGGEAPPARGLIPVDARAHAHREFGIPRPPGSQAVMVLGGKTLLWRENGIVFLRPPQAPPCFSTPGGETFLAFGPTFDLRLSRGPPAPALSGRDHLFTGRCDLVIPPLSRDPPRGGAGGGGKIRQGSSY
ncbi:hypothetical protein KM043_009868 [Ampulex compressa]|nr:hypothetical protein KM043_009868 [Ampulex compressa]